MGNTQESFVLYSDSLDELELISMESRGLLLTTVLHYVNGLELPELDTTTEVIWRMWKKNIDRNHLKWEETRQRRSAAGKKGGLAAKASNAKQRQANQAVTVPVTVTDTVPVNVTVPVTIPDSKAISKEATPQTIISFPLKNGLDYALSKDDIDEWQRQHPALDVAQTLYDIKEWLLLNPHKQRNQDGMDSLIRFWLNNAEKKAHQKEGLSHGEHQNLSADTPQASIIL